jgi:DNA invertase Pin-like site-specific DNA recombinase
MERVRGIGFETFDGVSTRGATGKLVLHILGSVAQFERQLLIERTMAGLSAARADGRIGGRRRKMPPQDIVVARRHMTEGKLKAHEVAKMYGISERSLWRNLRWAADLAEVRAGG